MDWRVYVYCLMASLIFLTIVFFVAHRHNRYDLIDSAWGLAFIAIAVISYLAQPSYSLFSTQSLVLLLIIIWGMRLSLHIYRRWNLASHEDKRYTAFRQKYAKSFGGVALNIYLKIYLVQAILAFVISLPIIILNVSETIGFGWYAGIGFIIWLIGFYFEAVGDAQLAAFIRNHRNKGKLMTQGLWRYTRHPNYFGEVMQWWGISVIVLSAPFGWLGVISPLMITILLLFISGVPLTEKHFEGRPGWDEYKKRTSKFIPLSPRH